MGKIEWSFWRAAACLMFLFALIPTAHACLGVSRTITISKFNSAMGTGPGGHIGLRHKEVVLTFDDGPIPATTNKILSALARECTKATFFPVGHMARAYPSTLRNIAARGHTIAFHTQTHANLQGVSLASAQRDIANGRKSILASLGKYRGRASRLFRYPYLSRNARLDQIVKRQGMLPFSASVLSQDWKSGSGAAMVNRVMSRLNRQGRGVILLHDIQKKTASALPSLLTRLKRGGYKVVHVRTSGQSKGPAIASVTKKKKPSKVARLKKSRKKTDRITTGSINKKSQPRKRLFSFSRSTNQTDKKKLSIQQKRRIASLARSKKLIEARKAEEKANKKKRRSIFKRTKKKSPDAKKFKKSASKKSKGSSKSANKVTKNKTTKTKKKRRIRLFANATSRKKGESAAAYHERLRQRRLRLNREQAAQKGKT